MAQTINERIKDFEIGLELMKLNLEKLKSEINLEKLNSVIDNTKILLEVEYENSIENDLKTIKRGN